MKKAKAVSLCVLFALSACGMPGYTPAPVEKTYFNFVLAGVPAETKCELVGSRGETETGRSLMYFGVYLKARSYGGEGMITCTLPDGQVYSTSWNQARLGPHGVTVASSMVYYKRGHKALDVVEESENFREVYSDAFVRVK